MPKGGRARVKVIKKKDDDKELMEMFSQMLDPSKADSKIVYPKYESLKYEIGVFSRLLISFATGPIQKAFDYELQEFHDVVAELTTLVEKHKDYTEENIVENWQMFKNDSIITSRVLTLCANLGRYKKYIGDKDNLRGGWIADLIVGTKIFPFSNIDLNIMWMSPEMQTLDARKYLLITLNMLYTHSRQIYEITTSPDIDIEKFSKVIVSALLRLKKTPGLERCHRAFALIERSVGKLEHNFKNYYRDMLQANNPNIIFESFITDIANDDGIDVATAHEFKKLISVLNKRMNSARSGQNPEISKLFGMVEDKLDMFDNIFNTDASTSNVAGGSSSSG